MKNKSKWLDVIESALLRAENARKDIDLILVMRAVRDILEEGVRDDDSRANNGRCEGE